MVVPHNAPRSGGFTDVVQKELLMAKKYLKSNTTLALTLAGLLTLTLGAGPSHAQTFNVIYNFTGETDGGNPLAGLTIDKSGNLYGTAEVGGALGYGTAFKLAKGASWKFDPVYSFASGADGSYPTSRLMPGPDGILYGVTSGGGGAGGQGTVFSLAAGGVETVLYRFTNGSGSGEAPSCNLIFDKQGNIYGTTSTGGSNSAGTVFKLVKPQTGEAWTEKVLYSFGQGSDGQFPIAGVTADSAGNLYGTTSAGGASGYGIIFKLTPSQSGWTETILHQFVNGSDGSVPYGGLIFDKSGNLYGAATQGGTGGGGTIYQLVPSGGNWTFNVLYSVPGWGISGTYRNVYLDASGNIYGTTHCDGLNSAGSVFELTPSGSGTWNYTSLHDFDVSDGQYVFSGLVFDTLGNIYGTTQVGGASGYGVVWEITP
jgi:uncharacterized repeat protein (TIGR03803 family)